MSDTASTTGYDAAEIADLAALGAKIEDTLDNLGAYIDQHNIFAEWNATLDTITTETGVTFSYYDSPYHEERYDWDMSLTAHGIEFTTLDHDNDRLYFFIPFTFLSPQTREQCIADLRDKYAAQAARQADAKWQQTQKEREQVERVLAKAQADLAALDAAQD